MQHPAFITDTAETSASTTEVWELPFCRLQLAEFSRAFPDTNGSEVNGSVVGFSGAAAPVDGQALAWFRIMLPFVCAFGISGNLLNIVILTRKRFLAPMQKLEKCANLGMIALAVSDLLFCLAVLPHSFLDRHPLSQGDPTSDSSPLLLYYKVYGISLINLLLMSSTWLIVALAVERYTVLYYPLRAKVVLSLRRSKLIIASIYATCCTLTLPYFLHKEVRRCSGLDGVVRHEIWLRFGIRTDWSVLIQVYIRHVWPAIAVFLPQLILFVCNVRLAQGLRSVAALRRRKCPGQKIRDANNRITLTLIIIVAMAIILVAPAEIMKAINPYTLWGERGYIIASLANLLQTLNFAINFALYCVIDRHFRHICRSLFLGRCFSDGSYPERHSRQPGVLLSHRPIMGSTGSP
ncbi:hypothetical protein LSH36_1466g00004 [Paralvinella palmiformis]|uniref:G-protein coupled receptors family 1 profile domain-containing protein n=1 Tax=Paralvinella palmiformis TaxID=53620 RepID=A0AAD9MRA1_9ANNE|nr:hypothetical protein LSH36_1466g00004 [Paralvinella palmiformis]